MVCAVTPGNSAVGELVEPRRAAAREHIVQLVLSERLERELGEALLERTTYHVQLTAAGHAFLFEAAAFLDSALVSQPRRNRSRPRARLTSAIVARHRALRSAQDTGCDLDNLVRAGAKRVMSGTSRRR